MTATRVSFSNPIDQDDLKKHNSTAWSTSNEVPLYIPITPRLDRISSPRLSPSLEGSVSDALLCTPSLKAANTANTVGNEQFADPRFQEIHRLLREQRDELNRVTADFGQRFSVLCCPSEALMVPLQLEHISAERHLAGHLGARPSANLTQNSWKTAARGGPEDTVDDSQPSVGNGDDTDSDQEKGGRPSTESLQGKVVKRWLQEHDGHHSNKNLSQSSLHLFYSMTPDPTPFQKKLKTVVHSRMFETISTSVIVCHAVVMGILADHDIRHIGAEAPAAFQIADTIFLCCYLTELVLRIVAERFLFVCSAWNLLDLLLVSLDLIHKVMDLIVGVGGSQQLSTATTARTFRVLRLLRIVRVIRSVRFFRELRMMLKCIGAGLRVVTWVWLILFMFVYIFAVFLLQQVSADSRRFRSLDIEYQETLRLRFGNLSTACFTLFMTITGGISWVECTDPLTALDWSNGVAFVLFIGLTMFVMLNIVSGIFVDCAMSAARADEEELMHDIMHNEDTHLHKIRALFHMADDDGQRVLSLEEFQCQMETNNDLRIWFKSLGIGVHEVRGLFRLLDTDESGVISVEEFITGCMRLKEGPSAIDLATLVLETIKISNKQRRSEREMARQFKSLHARMSKITRS